MRGTFADVADRGRVEIATNLAVGAAWALFAAWFGHLLGVLYGLLAAAFAAAAGLAFCKGRRSAVGDRASIDQRSVFAHMGGEDPLAGLPRRGLGWSLTGTTATAIGLLMVATAPTSGGVPIGGYLLFVLGGVFACVGVTRILRTLNSHETPSASEASDRWWCTCGQC